MDVKFIYNVDKKRSKAFLSFCADPYIFKHWETGVRGSGCQVKYSYNKRKNFVERSKMGSDSI